MIQKRLNPPKRLNLWELPHFFTNLPKDQTQFFLTFWDKL
ncbi:hypothetical protein G436_2418 [Leptospira interrogans serovar Hardjo str. Norma]|uniref:Uncharacterized protein n=1 Tax=Leptospira interrogans serovar Hardjo str. Norma TaxID=1279460 RepID=A0A0M4N947_LEPIR|nr:hypothetical protein G436_2418 [Leptospira interrogans serovar Hardjo str. Norma]